MLIERHEFLDPEGAKPFISGVTAFGNLVFLKGIAADPAGAISEQTRQVLRQIDDLLALARHGQCENPERADMARGHADIPPAQPRLERVGQRPTPGDRKFADSSLEGSGFEPSVPLGWARAPRPPLITSAIPVKTGH